MADSPEKRSGAPRSMQDDEARQLPKKFFALAAIAANADGFAIELDGRTVKTPKRAPLVVPSELLAAAIAAEWNALAEAIDPALLPLTKIANTALDGVTGRERDVHDDIVRYIGNDLLFYRADAPQELVARQAEAWDPVLDWIAATFDARFKITSGVMPVEQNLLMVAKAASALTGETALSLAPLHVITTLTGSALLAIAHLKGRLSAQELWQIAHIDEDWQAEQWGADDEAAATRAKKRAELDAAARFLALLNA